ncbi:ABC transporter transmembrane region 2-domain-containing protein [Phakopsora pachyrhizi]|nr:ABC transporter transmembrane region 2-domain-containing protein [Phakopsora pachyrhizi]
MPLELNSNQGAHRLVTYAVFIIPLASLIGFRRSITSYLSANRRRRDQSQQHPPQTPAYLSTPQYEIAQREMFKIRSDGTRELLIPHRGKLRKIVLTPTSQATLSAHSKLFSQPSTSISSNKRSVGVNREFFRQLRCLFRIIIPRSTSKEVFMVIIHTFFLLMRTYLSLLVARLDGIIVRDLVSADLKGFARGLLYWYLLAIPSTYTNAMIRFLQSKLALSFRTRLTRYLHDLYLSPSQNFYKLINLDTRIEAADQFITSDVSKFCESLSSLYSNVSKPTLDLILFNFQLGKSIGKLGSLGLIINYLITGWILRQITPAFGKLSAIETKLEGDFRLTHSRLITNSEEISFYNGAHLEKEILTRTYLRLIRHVNSIFKIRIAYSMVEDLVIKYAWSAVGYMLVSIPVFFPNQVGAITGSSGPIAALESKDVHSSVAKRTESYISNRRLMLALADAGGRMMSSGKDLAELAGYTSRVYTLLAALHDLNKGNYELAGLSSSSGEIRDHDLRSIRGTIIEGEEDVVEFSKVPIVVPSLVAGRDGEVLVNDLCIKIRPGEHCLINGPNGVGKTAIARVLAGLWPCFEGMIKKPRPDQIMYLPQRPYLSLGSLRDQIIYPHSFPQFQAMGGTDEDLMKILENAHLSYIPAREGGFDTVKEWKDVFSGGEKQRLAIARLFYHSPRFGVMDECTSAVSTDVEGLMYQHAKELGITLITISHKPSLLKYHEYLLTIGAKGSKEGQETGWDLKRIGSEEEKMGTVEKELEELRSRLSGVGSWKSRLEEISVELDFKK